MRLKRKYLLLLGLGLYVCLQAGGIAWSQVTERVSVDTTGSDADSGSSNPSTSSNGRYVAFQSDATDLVAGGSNGSMHIFVRDRQTGTTAQVSVDSGGNETLDPSRAPSISGDGMHVAFESDADLDLVAGDANAFSDIFVRDLLAVTTTLVSVDSDGAQDIGPSVSPSVSGDGRYVAFQSEADLVLPDNGFIDIYVHDRDADGNGTYDEAGPGAISTVRVSVDSAGIQGQGNNHSYFPSISADGRYVAFESIATDLVAGGTNGNVHIFVRDLLAGTTALVSVDSSDVQGNDDSSSASISTDGRYVAFESLSTNLVSGGTNGNVHIFVRDLLAGTTTLASVDSAGIQGNGDSNFPSISGDGRYVAFESIADNLVAGDTPFLLGGFRDVFVRDRDADGDGIYDEPGEVSTVRVSVDLAGVEGNGNSNAPSISADGSSVTFQSDADNLVGAGNDNNMAPDIFADDLQAAAGGGGGGGSSSGGGGCFISTAADGSGMAGEK